MNSVEFRESRARGASDRLPSLSRAPRALRHRPRAIRRRQRYRGHAGASRLGASRQVPAHAAQSPRIVHAPTRLREMVAAGRFIDVGRRRRQRPCRHSHTTTRIGLEVDSPERMRQEQARFSNRKSETRRPLPHSGDENRLERFHWLRFLERCSRKWAGNTKHALMSKSLHPRSESASPEVPKPTP